MSNLEENTEQLLRKYLNGTLSSEEYNELIDLLKVEVDAPYVERLLEERLEKSSHHPAAESVDWDGMLQAIFKEGRSSGTGAVHQMDRKSVTMNWKRLLVAASVVSVIALGALLYTRSGSQTDEVPTAQKVPTVIEPASDKALLTLANGQQIVLDNSTGTIKNEDGATVINVNGQLKYDDAVGGEKTVIHTVSTPRGGYYQVVLEDGTKVWLNAASSVKFPTIFTGTERVVAITGEAYFDVVHDTKRPFRVQLPDGSLVQVLGTEFNVQSYPEDESIITTLINGSVAVTKGAAKEIIRPGQQAKTELSNSNIVVKKAANLQQVTAWRKNIFLFDSDDLSTVMKQISRWYDVDVEYRATIRDRFTGVISREVNAADVLSMLEQTGAVQLTIEGKKIIVSK